MNYLGKIPPQAKELEEAVLGAILIDRDAFAEASGILGEEAFYVESHKKIFKAMRELATTNKPIDILMVTEELRRAGELEEVGGSYAITKLTNSVTSAANCIPHCRVILQKFVGREIIRLCGELMNEAFEDMNDSLALLDRAQQSFSQVDEHLSFGDMVPMTRAIVETMMQIEKWRQNDSPITGVSSGFKELDRATRGWQGGDLIIIAARPSKGKTAFALNLVRNAANSFAMHLAQSFQKAEQAGLPHPKEKVKSVGVWSLEMKYVMLVLRMLAAESGQILHRIQTGRMSDEEMRELFAKGVQKLARMGIFFDDKAGLTIQKLRSKARKLKLKENLGIIIVDYLQLMTSEGKGGSREQEVSKISRELKLLAQELDVPIIALSQLSRAVETRTGANSQPQLSDLRESGSIEQDADVVIFLYGPTDAEIAQDNTLLSRRYVKIAKQRNGMLLKLDLDFKTEIQLFEEIENVSANGIQKATEGLPAGRWKPVPTQPVIDFSEPKGNDEEDLPF